MAMLAIAGFAAASISYVAPAFADDMSGDDQSMQQGSDNGSDQSAAQSDSSSASDDSGTPDTATGDDDF